MDQLPNQPQTGEHPTAQHITGAGAVTSAVPTDTSDPAALDTVDSDPLLGPIAILLTLATFFYFLI